MSNYSSEGFSSKRIDSRIRVRTMKGILVKTGIIALESHQLVCFCDYVDIAFPSLEGNHARY